MNPADFWHFLEQLGAESQLIIDRPKNSAQSRFSNIIYPLDMVASLGLHREIAMGSMSSLEVPEPVT